MKYRSISSRLHSATSRKRSYSETTLYLYLHKWKPSQRGIQNCKERKIFKHIHHLNRRLSYLFLISVLSQNDKRLIVYIFPESVVSCNTFCETKWCFAINYTKDRVTPTEQYHFHRTSDTPERVGPTVVSGTNRLALCAKWLGSNPSLVAEVERGQFPCWGFVLRPWQHHAPLNRGVLWVSLHREQRGRTIAHACLVQSRSWNVLIARNSIQKRI
jgi:hypothetical protein